MRARFSETDQKLQSALEFGTTSASTSSLATNVAELFVVMSGAPHITGHNVHHEHRPQSLHRRQIRLSQC